MTRYKNYKQTKLSIVLILGYIRALSFSIQLQSANIFSYKINQKQKSGLKIFFVDFKIFYENVKIKCKIFFVILSILKPSLRELPQKCWA